MSVWKPRRIAPALGLGALLVACDAPEKRYAGLEFETLSTPPAHLSVSVKTDEVEIPAGLAVKVKVAIRSSEVSYDKRDLLSLSSEEDETFEVFETDSNREFILAGVNPGRTCLGVRINRKEKDCIDVKVTAQPSERELDPSAGNED